MDGTIIYDEIIETSLLRYGMKNNGTFGIIDDLSISYDGNRLLSVTDDAEPVNYNGALDFNDGADLSVEYEYNGIGALVRDSNRGINNIIYDYCSYPQIISMGYGQKEICYEYTPDGRKLYSRHTTRIAGVSSNTMNTVTDTYIDGLILRDGSPLMWQYDGGYVALNANAAPTSWNFYVTDHLGSTRLVVTNTNTIKETINYYPYGSEMRMTDPAQIANTSNKERFRFSGKELDFQNGLNMYDFGARMFDVAGVPVWTSVDPLAENNSHVTPYSYCNGDPVNAIDPDGKRIQIPETKDRYTVLNYINSMTNTVYSIDNKGFLYDTGKQKDNGGSKLYTSRINDAINKEDLSISIYIDQNYVDDGLIKDISSKGEGITQKEDEQAVAVVVSGRGHKTKDENGNYFNQSPEEILMHELIGHAIPIIAPSRLFDTGNAILNENKVRKELNLQLRQENEEHKQ